MIFNRIQLIKESEKYGENTTIITNIYIFILYLWLNITIIKLELIKILERRKNGKF